MVRCCDSRAVYGNDMRGDQRPRSAPAMGLTSSTCSDTSQSDVAYCDQLKETRVIAKQLAEDIIQYVMVSPSPPLVCRYAGTLRRIVDEVSAKHKVVFESIVLKVGVRNRSQPSDTTACRQTFEAVANELFADGHYNWGRIAMLYAFAAWLAKLPSDHCLTDAKDEVAQAIADAAGDYVAKRLASWIYQQGGWDTMESFFQEHQSVESLMWRGLVAALVGLGTMAVFASLTRQT